MLKTSVKGPLSRETQSYSGPHKINKNNIVELLVYHQEGVLVLPTASQQFKPNRHSCHLDSVTPSY